MKKSNQLKRKTDAEDEDSSPEPNQPCLVQCAEYRCVGLLNDDGKWVSASTGEELTDIVRIYPLN